LHLLRQIHKIEGDIAEVGVFKAGTSEIICKYKGKKKLLLFDRFQEGLPEPTKEDAGTYKNGQFTSNIKEVERRLRKYPNVFIYPGTFPETSEPIKNKKFSFLHIDVDLYKGTKDSLKFFYPRMSEGGIILIHDYISFSEGVRKAVDDFFLDKPEMVFGTVGKHCFIIKQRGGK